MQKIFLKFSKLVEHQVTSEKRTAKKQLAATATHMQNYIQFTKHEKN